MSSKEDPYLKGAVWIGLVIMLPSAAGMFGILNADAESFEAAPRWLAFSAVLMFFNCGIVVGFMDTGFNEYRETWWLSHLHGLAGLSIPLLFVMVLNWVAFGPGVREFSGGISIPFLSINFDRANEIIGRIFFGIPALLMDGVLLLVLYQQIAEFFGKKVGFLEMDEEKNDVVESDSE
jgi:hypothetical protein